MHNAPVYVGPSPFGRGVFASIDFVPSDLILRLTGMLITPVQANAMGHAEGNVLQVAKAAYIDLDLPGVYLNHSCDPNAGIRNRVELVALRNIPQGEEIRFDYSTTMSESRWTMQCACCAVNCRNIIMDFHHLPPSLQERYLSLDIVQSFIVAEVMQSRHR